MDLIGVIDWIADDQSVDVALGKCFVGLRDRDGFSGWMNSLDSVTLDLKQSPKAVAAYLLYKHYADSIEGIDCEGSRDILLGWIAATVATSACLGEDSDIKVLRVGIGLVPARFGLVFSG